MREETTSSAARDPHADLNVAARTGKARKIVHLLRDRVSLPGARILEVGTGSGVIAAALAEEVGPDGEVWGVDVVDQRLDRDAFRFVAVADTTLPFPDDSFDVAISNHVVEHVGDAAAQQDHVRELRRVLRPGGWLYLATPNRWAPLEPHFKLPFLSWLPEERRTAYVRAARRGARYDCRPLARDELVALLDDQGFESDDLSREAIRAMRDVERPSIPTGVLLRLAPVLLPVARPVLPTHVFLARNAL